MLRVMTGSFPFLIFDSLVIVVSNNSTKVLSAKLVMIALFGPLNSAYTRQYSGKLRKEVFLDARRSTLVSSKETFDLTTALCDSPEHEYILPDPPKKPHERYLAMVLEYANLRCSLTNFSINGISNSLGV